MEAEKTLTNEEIIRELLDLLKKNTMKEQANDVFEICTYVDGLEKKIVSMTEELTSMQDQIKKMQEDTLINNASIMQMLLRQERHRKQSRKRWGRSCQKSEKIKPDKFRGVGVKSCVLFICFNSRQKMAKI